MLDKVILEYINLGDKVQEFTKDEARENAYDVLIKCYEDEINTLILKKNELLVKIACNRVAGDILIKDGVYADFKADEYVFYNNKKMVEVDIIKIIDRFKEQIKLIEESKKRYLEKKQSNS